MIWKFANGDDHSPVVAAESEMPVKSIGNSTTTPRDLVTDDEVRIIMTVLCESVAARLREQKANSYRCRILNKETYLWFENPNWFVEGRQ